MASGTLTGARILIVEDEYYLADDVRSTLLKVGAEVVGPVPTIGAAIALVEGDDRIDGVLLDVNLRGEMAFAVADLLLARGIPFAFVTGYDCTALPERFSNMPSVQKPAASEDLIALCARLAVARAPK